MRARDVLAVAVLFLCTSCFWSKEARRTRTQQDLLEIELETLYRLTSNHWENMSLLSSTASYGELDSDDMSPGVNMKSPIFIFMCAVYTISTLTAIVTNLIVILVFFFGYGSKTDLSLFLFNLAVADFLMSTVCMPFTFAQALLKKWIFGSVMCPIVLFKQVLTVSLSIYTMVAIGIDRYVAVRSPLKTRNNHRRRKVAILLVWLVSILLASVQLFVARLQPEKHPTYDRSYFGSGLNASLVFNQSIVKEITTYTCNENWSSKSTRQTYTLFNFFAVYLIPVFILGYTYTRVAFIIKQTNYPGNADQSRDMNYNRSKSKVIKMLIVLVCAFTLCWLPLHAFFLISDFTRWLESMPNALWYFYSAHWLAMANCTLNPFIYGFSNKNFRSDVYSLIFCCKCETRREWRRRESYKTSSLLFRRLPRSNRMGYYNNNLNMGLALRLHR
nr:G protein-coupled receptor [Proales similis]